MTDNIIPSIKIEEKLFLKTIFKDLLLISEIWKQ